MDGHFREKVRWKVPPLSFDLSSGLSFLPVLYPRVRRPGATVRDGVVNFTTRGREAHTRFREKVPRQIRALFLILYPGAGAKKGAARLMVKPQRVGGSTRSATLTRELHR